MILNLSNIQKEVESLSRCESNLELIKTIANENNKEKAISVIANKYYQTTKNCHPNLAENSVISDWQTVKEFLVKKEMQMNF